MNYSLELKNVVDFCNTQHLFLGFGNPNGRVLLIGKEQAFDHIHAPGTEEFLNEILENRQRENKTNIAAWKENIENNFIPEWENMPIGLTNPLYAWGSQLNVANKLKNKIGNGGTSNTYLKYQKLHQYLNNQKTKSDRINFQKDFFLTELNEIATKYSYGGKELKKIRNESIEKRKDLFRMDFFKCFPITIIAAGHYPRDYNFNIEHIFDVKFSGETTVVGRDYYNVHYNSDSNRIVIHTRQLSMAVTDELIEAIAEKCSPFLNRIG
ncbi:hypothetical protein G6M26_23375 [Agrobacterium tumefaciens]|nr:hypothetical protein [Agrobacterium tumefaciens]NTE21485.1 hypothetical protein [Agrobacterium tumefaciens]